METHSCGIAISIVLFNPSYPKLSQVLSHLKEALLRCDREGLFRRSLVLVDNSVPPIRSDTLAAVLNDSYFGLRHAHHQTMLIQTGKNVGYGAAHNLAMRAHHFAYHLILNPDVYVYPDALSVCWHYAHSHDHVSLIGPAVFSPDGSRQYLLRREISLTDVSLRLLGIFLKPIRRLHRYRHYECQDVNMAMEQEGYLMSGCCMWCKTEALRAVGGFDERFFLYYEDYDLSERLRRSSTVVYLPQFRVVHEWERVMERTPRLMWYNLFSAMRFFQKWGWRLAAR